jgi:Icc protein
MADMAFTIYTTARPAGRPDRQELMSDPFTLVQISDPHIGAAWGVGDPDAKLAAAVDSIRALAPTPNALLVSGDLAENAADAEYGRLRSLLSPLDAPLHVLPGNHDDRGVMRRHFALPGEHAEPVQYAADLGPLRLVALDTSRPGEDRGELDPARLGWLENTLADEPERPTLVAMHHPPLSTGIPAMDEIGLPADDRRGLGEVVRRHPQVRRIVAGHVHCTAVSDLDGRVVLAVPSTYVQIRLDFDARELRLDAEPTGFALHVMLDGTLVSHIQPVTASN